MKAAELRIILEHVPGDLDVIVMSPDACHIDVAERVPSRSNRSVRGLEAVQLPQRAAPAVRSNTRRPALFLRAGAAHRLGGTPWWEPAPAFYVKGPFDDLGALHDRLDSVAGAGSTLREAHG